MPHHKIHLVQYGISNNKKPVTLVYLQAKQTGVESQGRKQHYTKDMAA